jgi:hypothetical protein
MAREGRFPLAARTKARQCGLTGRVTDVEVWWLGRWRMPSDDGEQLHHALMFLLTLRCLCLFFFLQFLSKKINDTCHGDRPSFLNLTATNTVSFAQSRETGKITSILKASRYLKFNGVQVIAWLFFNLVLIHFSFLLHGDR